jgi:hypothetical protein
MHWSSTTGGCGGWRCHLGSHAEEPLAHEDTEEDAVQGRCRLRVCSCWTPKAKFDEGGVLGESMARQTKEVWMVERKKGRLAKKQ